MKGIILCLVLLPCILAQLHGTWVGTKTLRGISSPAVISIDESGIDTIASLFGGSFFSLQRVILSVNNSEPINLSFQFEFNSNVTVQIGTLSHVANHLSIVLQPLGNFTFPPLPSCPTCAVFELDLVTIAPPADLIGSWTGTDTRSSVGQLLEFTSDNKFILNGFTRGIFGFSSPTKMFIGWDSGRNNFFGKTSTASVTIDKTFGTLLNLLLSVPGLDNLNPANASIFSVAKQDNPIDPRLEGAWFGLDNAGNFQLMSFVPPLSGTDSYIFNSLLSESGSAYTLANTVNASANSIGGALFIRSSRAPTKNRVQYVSFSFPNSDPKPDALQIITQSINSNVRAPQLPYIVQADSAQAFKSVGLDSSCPSCTLTQYLRYEPIVDSALQKAWVGTLQSGDTTIPVTVLIGGVTFTVNQELHLMVTRKSAAGNSAVITANTLTFQYAAYQLEGGCLTMVVSEKTEGAAPALPFSAAATLTDCPTCQIYQLTCEGCFCGKFQAVNSGSSLGVSVVMFLVLVLSLLL